MAEEIELKQFVQGARVVNPDVDIDDLLKLAKDTKKLEKVFKDAKELKLLVLGKTGVGKSTLINGLIGKEVAEVSFGLSTTGVSTEVVAYHKTINGIDVAIFDSPGLEDGSGKDDAYLDELHEKCHDVDLVIFIIRYSDNRFVPQNPDARAMVRFTESFGVSVWNKAIVIISCCNLVLELNPPLQMKSEREKKAFFKELIGTYREVIHTTLVRDAHILEEETASIKVVPVGHEFNAYLLDGTLWFSNFWLECLTAIPISKARVAMLKLNAGRLKSSKEIPSGDFMMPISQQPIYLPKSQPLDKAPISTVASVVIPAAIGGGIGALGLIAGPVGLVGIPVGIFIGMIIGAMLTVKIEPL